MGFDETRNEIDFIENPQLENEFSQQDSCFSVSNASVFSMESTSTVSIKNPKKRRQASHNKNPNNQIKNKQKRQSSKDHINFTGLNP